MAVPTPIKPADALKLSIWLAATDPKLFRTVLNHVARLKNTPAVRMGFFGDDAAVTDSGVDITVSAPAIAPVTVADPNIDTGSLAAIDTSTDLSNISAPSIDTSIADSSQSGGSFWSTLGSAAQSVASGVGSLAASLANPQVLSSVAGAVKTYYQTQTQTAAVHAQTQIAQMQLNRVMSGYSPAPVSYTKNPVTGALTPVYASNSGLTGVSGQLYNQLLYPSTMGINPTYLIIGAVGLFALIALKS